MLMNGFELVLLYLLQLLILICSVLPKGWDMDHMYNSRGFPERVCGDGDVCVSASVSVCVLTAAPWTLANVMSLGFLKAGSLSCVLHQPLRRVTFTTTGALGPD